MSRVPDSAAHPRTPPAGSVLARLDPVLRARLVGIVARPCAARSEADEETEQFFDRTWRAACAAGFEAGRVGEYPVCAADPDHYLAFVASACTAARLRGTGALFGEAAGTRECLGRVA